jgi:hypothetical protein
VGLREQAVLDAQAILENTNEFGVELTVTNPAGASAAVKGYSADVHLLMDPGTGQAVTGRKISCALHMRSLVAAGLDTPVGVSDPSAKPWRVAFADSAGESQIFKVVASEPDRVLGVLVLWLEVLRT